MNNNVLYFIVGALVIATGFLGYRYYQSTQQPSGIQINLGEDGISVTPEK